MREVFQQELREVQERLVEIAGLVAISIDNATTAFNESNVTLAEKVIADDDQIDAAAPSRSTSSRSTSWPARTPSPATCASS